MRKTNYLSPLLIGLKTCVALVVSEFLLFQQGATLAPVPLMSPPSFVRQIVRCDNLQRATRIGDQNPMFHPKSHSVIYRDDRGEASLRFLKNSATPDVVRLFFSLTAFPNDEKDHYLHSALLLKAVGGDRFVLRNTDGVEQRGRYLVLDAHEGLMGITVGDDRTDISKAMLNLEEKWIARHDSYDLDVGPVLLTHDKIAKMCRVIQESGSKEFTIPVHLKRVRFSVFVKGILAQQRSHTLEQYNNCGLFNIRLMKALGIKENPIDKFINSCVRKSFISSLFNVASGRESLSIEEAVKHRLLERQDFIALAKDRDKVKHYPGDVSYDYRDPKVLENAFRASRNWTMLMKSFWYAL